MVCDFPGTVNVGAPELTSNTASSKLSTVSLTEKAGIECESIIVNLMLQLISNDVWKIVMSVYQRHSAENMVGSFLVVGKADWLCRR